jgi:predicted nuclease of predicted toxin-antitoxin system
MRFLANENFPGSAVAALKAGGHDVVWVRIAAPGAADREVLTWAAREERVLLTFDKDFGELARKATLRPSVASFCCACRFQSLERRENGSQLW